MTAPHDARTPAYLRIGVVGARRVPEDALGWLGEGLRQAFAMAATLHADTDAAMPLRLVSGMAAGADRLAIDTFLDWRAQWQAARPQAAVAEVLALLPCPAPMFRDQGDVAAAGDAAAELRVTRERVDFERQLAWLGADPDHCAVLELHGELPRSSDPARHAMDKHTRGEAHRQQAQVLIRQVDALIVVLDLHAAGEVGGSRETLEAALAMHTPVLVFDLGRQQLGLPDCVAHLHADRFAGATGDLWARWQAALRQRVPMLPRDLPHDAEVLRQVYDAASWRSTWRLAHSWGKFEAVFKQAAGTASTPEPERHVELRWWRAWATVVRAVLAAVFAWLRPPAPAPESAPAPGSAAEVWLEQWRGRLSKRQQDIMAAYRGAFLGNYLLGLLAVVLALTIIVLLLIEPQPCASLIALLLALTALKLGVVWRIAYVTHQANAQDLNHGAVALRYVCERLRPMPVLVRLGAARPDLLHRTPRRGPPADVADDLCRRLPLRTLCAEYRPGEAAQALRKLLSKQIDYHEGASRKFRHMFRVLERCVQSCGRAVIWVVAVDLLLLGYKFTMTLAPAWLHHLPAVLAHALHAGHDQAALLGKIAVALTALLPAAMATLNAIAFQSQAEPLGERHAAMAASLTKLRVQVQCALDDAHPVAAGSLLDLSERVSALLAEEVAEWASVYRSTVREA